jgi:uncharacterized protein (DUF362 family)
VSKSANSAGVSTSSSAEQNAPHIATAILRREPDAGLDGILQKLRSASPSLLPASLPPKVVIKPNLCDIVSWEAGVTTDPSWLPVLAAELRAIRPDVRILVVESDAISAYKSFRSCDETFDRLGYREIARANDVELVNLSNTDSIEISLEGIPLPILISELFLEEFYFISVANLKVHGYEYMTGILKNSLGLLSGSDLTPMHPYLPMLISELHRLCPPDLCIIDGRIGLEGHGPIIGDPVAVNAVVFSNDALAADAAACKLMGIPPQEVPHLRETAKNLGRRIPEVTLPSDIQPHSFSFNTPDHRAILLKFANRRFHRASETLANNWINRFLRFKREPLKFASEAIPKLVRRLHAK